MLKENKNYKVELENAKKQNKLLKSENTQLKEEVEELRRKISIHSAIASGDETAMVFTYLLITYHRRAMNYSSWIRK